MLTHKFDQLYFTTFMPVDLTEEGTVRGWYQVVAIDYWGRIGSLSVPVRAQWQ